MEDIKQKKAKAFAVRIFNLCKHLNNNLEF